MNKIFLRPYKVSPEHTANVIYFENTQRHDLTRFFDRFGAHWLARIGVPFWLVGPFNLQAYVLYRLLFPKRFLVEADLIKQLLIPQELILEADSKYSRKRERDDLELLAKIRTGEVPERRRQGIFVNRRSNA